MLETEQALKNAEMDRFPTPRDTLEVINTFLGENFVHSIMQQHLHNPIIHPYFTSQPL
jgi:hypothetical protein